MTEENQAPRLPLSHAIAGVIATGGALVTLVDMPVAEPHRAALWVPAVAYWMIAMLFQLLVAAGHLRTAILDRQHLVGSPNFERRGAWNWVVTHLLVLGMVGMFYLQAQDSLPLLTGQASALVALLVTNLCSLAVWSVRIATSQTAKQAELSDRPTL